MKLNRLAIFLIGFAAIVAVYFAQRAYAYRSSEFTHGMFVCDDSNIQFYEADMTLHYYVDGKEYEVATHDDTRLAFKEVRVRYPKGAPEKGCYYTPGRFWGVAALWLIIPFMLWGAIVFTFFNENAGLQLSFSKKSKEDHLIKS